MSLYAKYPSLPAGGVTSYATRSDFPATAADGTLALARDTDFLYAYNAGSMSWVLIAGAGSILSIGPIDSTTPSANGADIVLDQLIMQSASVSDPGLVNLTTQSFAGNKTFTGAITASNLSGTNTGDVTLGTPSGLSLSGQVLSLGLSSASVTGALSSSDFATFAAKQPAGNYITALTGDGTASGPGSVALTLATVNTSPGSYNFASLVVNSKGLVTAASATSIGDLTAAGTDGIAITNGAHTVIGTGTSIAQQVSDATHNGYLASTDFVAFSGKQPSGNYITALTGDVIATGPGSVASTIQPNVVSNSKLAQMPTLTIKGNNTGSTANAADLTVAQVNAILPIFTSTLNGLVPLSGGGTVNFLRADGTWAPVGSGAGTVTSVTFTGDGTVLSATPSTAVTTSGTVTATLKTQNAGTFLAGPTSGSAAAPTFRALQAPTVQKFTSGSGTYTPSAGVLYASVRMVGGGGGANGSGTATGTAAGSGTASTFGTQLSAGGGTGAVYNASVGSGGTATLGTVTTGVAINGQNGSGWFNAGASIGVIVTPGGAGGNASYFVGGGQSQFNTSGGSGMVNTGGGGGGGGNSSITANFSSGAGGGAGGYVEAIISPVTSVSYQVGAGGTAGGAGTSGFAGGAGGSGVIIVTEYYQ